MNVDATEKVVTDSEMVDESSMSSMLLGIIKEIVYSPINLGLVVVIGILIYKIIKDRFEVPSVGTLKPAEPELPKMRRDFTVEELRQFDGTQSDGRVLVAVNGKVFDVTKGKRFYGPGGPYATFAGRDASRNLATFSVQANEKDDFDLSDLSAIEMDSVREWEMQFKEKYELVGKLLRKGEQPTNYEDEEEDTATDAKVVEITADPDSTVAPADAAPEIKYPTVADDEGVHKRINTKGGDANATTDEEVK